MFTLNSATKDIPTVWRYTKKMNLDFWTYIHTTTNTATTTTTTPTKFG
jgi:hypothetical protein